MVYVYVWILFTVPLTTLSWELCILAHLGREFSGNWFSLKEMVTNQVEEWEGIPINSSSIEFESNMAWSTHKEELISCFNLPFAQENYSEHMLWLSGTMALETSSFLAILMGHFCTLFLLNWALDIHYFDGLFTIIICLKSMINESFCFFGMRIFITRPLDWW